MVLFNFNPNLIIFKGDPLDIKMFESSGWHLNDENLGDQFDEVILAIVKPPTINKQSIKDENFQEKEIGIIRRFDFSSKL